MNSDKASHVSPVISYMRRIAELGNASKRRLCTWLDSFPWNGLHKYVAYFPGQMEVLSK